MNEEEFREWNEILDLSKEDVDRLTKEITQCFKNTRDLEELFKEIQKIPRNEEEMKFVFIKFGQIEMLGWSICLLRNLGIFFPSIMKIIPIYAKGGFKRCIDE